MEIVIGIVIGASITLAAVVTGYYVGFRTGYSVSESENQPSLIEQDKNYEGMWRKKNGGSNR